MRKNHKLVSFVLAILFFTISLAGCISILPETSEAATADCLFIGNSMTFYNNMPEMLSKMSKAGQGKALNYDYITYGGRYIYQHAAAVDAVIRTKGKYSALTTTEAKYFDNKSEYSCYADAIWNSSTASVKTYSTVIIQMSQLGSAGDSSASSIYKSLKSLISNLGASGTTFILVSTWGTEFTSFSDLISKNKTKDINCSSAVEMIKSDNTLAGKYRFLGVARVGRAFSNYFYYAGSEAAKNLESAAYDVYLNYGKYAEAANDLIISDLIHPTQLGTYIEAAVIYSLLYHSASSNPSPYVTSKSYTGGSSSYCYNCSTASYGINYALLYNNGAGFSNSQITRVASFIAYQSQCASMNFSSIKMAEIWKADSSKPNYTFPYKKVLDTPVLNKTKSYGTASKIVVYWNAVNGADKYVVYRKTSNSSWTKVSFTSNLYYKDTNIVKGTKYYYTVACVSSDNTTIKSAYNSSGICIEAENNASVQSVDDCFVVLSTNGYGENPDVIYLEKGSCISEIPDPVYEGYSFAGWYTDSLYTEKYDLSLPVDNDMILYAKWDLIIPEFFTDETEITDGSGVTDGSDVTDGSEVTDGSDVTDSSEVTDGSEITDESKAADGSGSGLSDENDQTELISDAEPDAEKQIDDGISDEFTEQNSSDENEKIIETEENYQDLNEETEDITYAEPEPEYESEYPGSEPEAAGEIINNVENDPYIEDQTDELQYEEAKETAFTDEYENSSEDMLLSVTVSDPSPADITEYPAVQMENDELYNDDITDYPAVQMENDELYNDEITDHPADQMENDEQKETDETDISDDLMINSELKREQYIDESEQLHAAVLEGTYFNVYFSHNTLSGSTASQSVLYGGTAVEPKAPEAEGYSFDGWYLEASCKTAYDFSQPVTKDIILYAKWTEDIAEDEMEKQIINEVLAISGHSFDSGVIISTYPCCSRIRIYTCQVGGELLAETLSASASHKLVHVSSKAATYTTAGRKECWYCKTCGKYFSNSSGTKEISASSIRIPVLSPKKAVLKSISAGKSGTTISWSEAAGADYYIVYRRPADSSSWTKVAATKKLTYTDKTVKSAAAKYYYYTVVTYNSSSKLRGSYNKTGVTVVKMSAPSVFTSSAANGIKVTWDSVSMATAYRVYRKSQSGSWKALTSTTSLSILDKTAEPGVIYYYTVRPYSAYGLSWGSYNKTGTAGIWLSRPVPSVYKNKAKNVILTWANVKNSVGYYVYRKVKGGSWEYIGTAQSSSGTVSFKDRTALKNKTYYYKVKAYTYMNNDLVFSGYNSGNVSVTVK